MSGERGSGRRRVRPSALVLTFALASFVLPLAASARSQADLGWSLAEIFNVAIRFIRVDRDCRIVDKDADTAFLIFECPSEKEKEAQGKAPVKKGALELYTLTSTKNTVRAQLTLSDEPRYMEVRFLELLERKLREERGSPSPARGQPATPDGGT